MRAFTCKRCRQLVTYESNVCANCGALLGFDPDGSDLQALRADGRHLVPHDIEAGPTVRWARCRRSKLSACNWLVPAAEAGRLCPSCRLTRATPQSTAREYRAAFAKAELAKRRLLYQLGQLNLPIVSRQDDPQNGLAFDLLAGDSHVVTSHDNGIITIDLNETDDVFREQARAQFGEPYRTLLGHFRHEIGHYYWQHLVGRPRSGGTPDAVLAEAEALFGDYRSGYEEARRSHYSGGLDPGWQENYVSAYAAMHPLEDWAETFAHYLHIWDTVQTAASFGVLVAGPVDDRTGRRDPAHASVPSEDTAELEGFDAVIADWLPLTMALNALNRSMGRDDLYPFELCPAVIAKLAFVHKVITAKAA